MWIHKRATDCSRQIGVNSCFDNRICNMPAMHRGTQRWTTCP